jgi:general secretion pathway protein G
MVKQAPGRRGFTLIELLVVMGILGTLLTIAVPRYFQSLDRSREVALRQTLAATRDAIDKYHGDTGKYPDSLEELVSKRYLRRMPFDPLTQSDRSWRLVAVPGDAGSGAVYDLHSGAAGAGRDGAAYAEW